MIPRNVLAGWRRHSPWRTDLQVEQDLILHALAIEVAQHDVLREHLIWRGGTCLHKLHLDNAHRYSEDLDDVLLPGIAHGDVKHALTQVAEHIGLTAGHSEVSDARANMTGSTPSKRSAVSSCGPMRTWTRSTTPAAAPMRSAATSSNARRMAGSPGLGSVPSTSKAEGTSPDAAAGSVSIVHAPITWTPRRHRDPFGGSRPRTPGSVPHSVVFSGVCPFARIVTPIANIAAVSGQPSATRVTPSHPTSPAR